MYENRVWYGRGGYGAKGGAGVLALGNHMSDLVTCLWSPVHAILDVQEDVALNIVTGNEAPALATDKKRPRSVTTPTRRNLAASLKPKTHVMLECLSWE